MTVDVAGLKRLSELLDEVLELDEPARADWLSSLDRTDASSASLLRDMLRRQAAGAEDSMLARGWWLDAANGPAVGDSVGPYRLLRELGSGGMAAVWLAERSDGQLQRKVALKLPHTGWTPGLMERFAREREILSTLEHPNIARLYDVGNDAQGRPYMAMEYVEGEAIDHYCRRQSLAVEARLRLLTQVAEAVAFAHSRLIVHRDLKPGNILVTAQGQVRLLDFGIAKLMMDGSPAEETALTHLSGRALSRDYASPEQIRGEPIGTASDVYSLAVVAFELLTGRRPYRLEEVSGAALADAIVGIEIPAASSVVDDPALRQQLRGNLDAILNKALKKSPNDRYPTVDALAQDWQRHLEGSRVQARRDTLADRAWRIARRHRIPLATVLLTVLAFGLAFGAGAMSIVIVALSAGLGAALWQAHRAREHARLARLEAATSRAVQGFLEDLFKVNARGARDPQRARQRTAKDLLDEGTARIQHTLGDVPEAKFKLLKTLAEMHADLGESNRAIALCEQRASLAERLWGSPSAPLVEALAAWGKVLAAGEQHDSARSVLDRAKQTLDGLAEPNPQLCVDVELALGELYRYVRDPRGLPHAERAMELLMRGEPSTRWLDAQLLLGSMQALAQRADEAAGTLSRAIALAPSVPGGEAHLPMLQEAAAMIAEDRGDAAHAEALLRSAIAIETRLSGSANSGTVAFMRQLARLLTNQGRQGEALSVFAEARAIVEAWPASPDRELLEHLLLMLEGRAWQGYGHPVRALAAYDRALELTAIGLDNPRSVAIMQTGRCVALCDLGRLGAAGEALALVQTVMRDFDVQGADVVFNECQAAIRLALAHGDREQALVRWTRYASSKPPDLAQAWVLLLRAEIAWSDGDAAGTEAQAAAALERMQAPPPPFNGPRLAVRARQLLACARLAQGCVDEALQFALQAQQAAVGLQDPAYGLDCADVDVDLARILLAQGDVPRARALLEAVRAVHAQHPEVGERYVAPLLGLQEALVAEPRTCG